MHIDSFIQYLSFEKNYSRHTVEAYERDVKQFFEFLKLEAVDSIGSVNYSIIRGWIAFLLEEGVSKRTANRKIASIKSFYKFLQVQGVIETNPLNLHKSLKESRKIEVPFSVDEIRNLLDAEVDSNDFSSVRDQLIIELFYVTGMRRSELIELKVTDLNFSTGTISIIGKRNKERKVPLLKSVSSHLKDYLVLRILIAPPETKQLLLTNKGTKMYPNFVYRVIKSYFSTVSLKVKISPHILRHSFATHLLNNGADLISVKELLGHASLASTQVYTHMGIQSLKDVYGKTHPRSNKN
ncbi:MAG: tyrosine-type recombinase/integrase [Nonlabens sp.]